MKSSLSAFASIAFLLILVPLLTCASDLTKWVTLQGDGGDIELWVVADEQWDPLAQYGTESIDAHVSSFTATVDGSPLYDDALAWFRRTVSCLRTASNLKKDIEQTAEFCPFVPLDHSYFQYYAGGAEENYVIYWASPGVWQGNVFVWRNRLQEWLSLPGTPCLTSPISNYNIQDTRVRFYKDALTRTVYQLARQEQNRFSLRTYLNSDIGRAANYLRRIVAEGTGLSTELTDDLADAANALERLGEIGSQPGASVDPAEIVGAPGVPGLYDRIKAGETALENSTVVSFVESHFSVGQLQWANKWLGRAGKGLKYIKAALVGLNIGENIANIHLINSLINTVFEDPAVEARLAALESLDQTHINQAFDPALSEAINEVIAEHASRAASADDIAWYDIPEARDELSDAFVSGAQFAIDVGAAPATKLALAKLGLTPGVGQVILLAVSVEDSITMLFDIANDQEALLHGNAALSIDRYLSREIKIRSLELGRDYADRVIDKSSLQDTACLSSIASYAAYHAIESRKSTVGSAALTEFVYNLLTGTDPSTYVDMLDYASHFYLHGPIDTAVAEMFVGNEFVVANKQGPDFQEASFENTWAYWFDSQPWDFLGNAAQQGGEIQVPLVSISSLSPSPVTHGAGSVLCQGAYDDADTYDAGLTENWEWRSSLDGVLGSTPVLSVDSATLAIGVHTITFTYTDNDGQAASASGSLDVLPAPEDQGYDLALDPFGISGGSTFFDIDDVCVRNVGTRTHPGFTVVVRLVDKDGGELDTDEWVYAEPLAVGAEARPTSSTADDLRVSASGGYRGPATIQVTVQATLDENRGNNTRNASVNVGQLEYTAYEGKTWTVVFGHHDLTPTYGPYQITEITSDGATAYYTVKKNGTTVFDGDRVANGSFEIFDSGAAALYSSHYRSGGETRICCGILLGASGNLAIEFSPASIVVMEGTSEEFVRIVRNAYRWDGVPVSGYDMGIPDVAAGSTVRPWWDGGTPEGGYPSGTDARRFTVAPPKGNSGVHQFWTTWGDMSISLSTPETVENDTPLRAVRLEMTVQQAPEGTVSLTSTPDASPFDLTGPDSFSHSGTTPWSKTDAPAPGAYTVSWGARSGYAAPPSQTEVLTIGGSLSFTGTYTAVNWNPGALGISPAVPTAVESLQAIIGDPSEDSQGDPVSYGYRWYRDSVLISNLVGAIVPASEIVKNDVWHFETRAKAGSPPRYSDWVPSAAVTVENSPPSAHNRFTAGAEDTSVSILLTATDVDADPLTYEISDHPFHGDLVLSNSVARYESPSNWFGDVSFTFRAHDGTSYSGLATSTVSVLSVNDLPTFDTITPATGDLAVALGATQVFSVAVSDVDDASVLLFWYVNGQFVHEGTSFEFVPTSKEDNMVNALLVGASDGHGTAFNDWSVTVGDPGLGVLLTLDVAGPTGQYVTVEGVPAEHSFTNRYPLGSEITLQAVSTEGAYFHHWDGDSPYLLSPAAWKYTNSLTYYMDRNKTIAADFRSGSPVGAVQVLLQPQAAADAGAQWRLDSGEWQPSGAVVPNVEVGHHTISFSSIPTWITPADQPSSVVVDQTNVVHATYSPDPALTVVRAHYRLDGNAQDSGSNAWHATFVGSPAAVAGVDGVAAHGYSFNGSDQRTDVPRAVLEGLPDRTIALWFKSNGGGGHLFSFNRWGGAHPDDYLVVRANGTFMGHYWGGADIMLDGGSTTVNDGLWHHACLRLSSARGGTLFLDGAPIAQQTASPIPLSSSANNHFTVGCENSGNAPNYDNFFGGHLDDVRLYGRTLSDAEIWALFHEDVPAERILVDEFEDGDFTQAPHWQMDAGNAWQVSAAGAKNGSWGLEKTEPSSTPGGSTVHSLWTTNFTPWTLAGKVSCWVKTGELDYGGLYRLTESSSGRFVDFLDNSQDSLYAGHVGKWRAYYHDGATGTRLMLDTQPVNQWVKLEYDARGTVVHFNMYDSGGALLATTNLNTTTPLRVDRVTLQWNHRPCYWDDVVYVSHDGTRPDCDADGLPDEWEIGRFGSLTNANFWTDSDGDGVCDGYEEIAGTMPTDGTRYFAISEAALDSGLAGQLVLRWDSVSGRLYTISCRSNLLSGAWIPVTQVPGNGNEMTYTNDVTGEACRFLRLGVQKTE